MKSLLISPFLFFFILLACKKETISIKPAPRPEFSADKRNIEVGDSVVFTNNSIGEIETYSWSFEGAETTFSNQKNPPTMYYKKAGRFLVSLTVGGPNGSNTITKSEYI